MFSARSLHPLHDPITISISDIFSVRRSQKFHLIDSPAGCVCLDNATSSYNKIALTLASCTTISSSSRQQSKTATLYEQVSPPKKFRRPKFLSYSLIRSSTVSCVRESGAKLRGIRGEKKSTVDILILISSHTYDQSVAIWSPAASPSTFNITFVCFVNKFNRTKKKVSVISMKFNVCSRELRRRRGGRC